jgi:hypothetical protein
MRGLDIIGAGEGLAAYTIVLHVRSIDTAKLRSAVTDSSWGAVIPAAIAIVDSQPQAALEIAVPLVKSQLDKAGIMADVITAKAAPPFDKALPAHQMLKGVATGLGIGAVAGVMLALFGKKVYHLIRGTR